MLLGDGLAFAVVEIGAFLPDRSSCEQVSRLSSVSMRREACSWIELLGARLPSTSSHTTPWRPKLHMSFGPGTQTSTAWATVVNAKMRVVRESWGCMMMFVFGLL